MHELNESQKIDEFYSTLLLYYKNDDISESNCNETIISRNRSGTKKFYGVLCRPLQELKSYRDLRKVITSFELEIVWKTDGASQFQKFDSSPC